jgi:DNA (cytosine-5)-methyltransferase 1
VTPAVFFPLKKYNMKYLSLCSGIEAATVAWHPLGWEAVAYSEIERFPSEVLAHHYPSTPNLGDMTKFKEWSIESNVDLLVGGTPCQSFSVAGLRKGLDDPRGNLMLTYLAIADKFKPQWIVWENVPGVLSSNGGKDFGVFLGALGELGYGFAYRVLDAQYFGVAQRRRRVFVVGYLGDWRRAAAVLFERDSLQGHPAPSREKGQAIAPSVTTGPPFSRTGNDRVKCEAMVATPKWWDGGDLAATITTKSDDQRMPDKANAQLVMQPCYGIPGNWIGRQPENGGNAVEPMHDVAPCLTKTDRHGVAQPIPLNTMTMQGRPSDDGRMGSGIGEPGDPCPTLTKAHSHAVAQPIAFSGQMSNPHTDVNMTPTLQAKNPMAVAVGTDLYNGNITGDVAATMGTPGSSSNASGPTVMQAVGAFKPGQSAQAGIGYATTLAPTLEAGGGGNNKPAVHVGMAVRRLTPVECERLQGFPDSYTDIKSKNKPTPDGPRYKALGNSMAVPVMAWIGQRIEQVEAICKQNK